MTKLESYIDKETGETVTPVVARELPIQYHGRALTIAVSPRGITYRPKGKRESYFFDHEVALAAAMKQAARDKGVKI